MELKIKSIQELQELFEAYPCRIKLEEESFAKTRYISWQQYKDLVVYQLDFQPYAAIAERCAMTSMSIMRSPKTNTFYIGFINLGGHAAAVEIRPVRLQEAIDFEYLERMFAHHARNLDIGIDLQEDYEI